MSEENGRAQPIVLAVVLRDPGILGTKTFVLNMLTI